MILRKTRSLTVMTAAFIGLTMFAFGLPGCGGDDDPQDTHDHADGDADHSHDEDAPSGGSSGAGDDTGGGDGAGEEEYSQLTPETFQQLKDMWALQIEGPRAQAETLRQVEAEHNDAQLKDLIAQIDAKVAALRTMLDEATVANGSKTLQIDIPRVLGEAGQLVEKASTRMHEVLGEKFGGGGGDDGGSQ